MSSYKHAASQYPACVPSVWLPDNSMFINGLCHQQQLPTLSIHLPLNIKVNSNDENEYRHHCDYQSISVSNSNNRFKPYSSSFKSTNSTTTMISPSFSPIMSTTQYCSAVKTEPISSSCSEWNCISTNYDPIGKGHIMQQTTQQLDQFSNLVHKECINEIDQACEELAISADPYNWNVVDVRKWLCWMQRLIGMVPFKLENFNMDGMALCALSEDEFKQRAIGGEKLHAKLDIWRIAINCFRPETILDSMFGMEQEEPSHNVYNQFQQQQSQQQQQQQQQTLQISYQSSSCGSPYSTDSSSYGSSPISPEGYGFASNRVSIGNCHQVSYSSDYVSSIGSPPSPAGSSHSTMTCASPLYNMGTVKTSSAVAPPPSQHHQHHHNSNYMAPIGTQTNLQSVSINYGTIIGSNGTTPPPQPQRSSSHMLECTPFTIVSSSSPNHHNNMQRQQQHQQQQQQQHLTTSDYGSDAILSDDDEMSNDECTIDYHIHHHQHQQQQQSQMQHQQQVIGQTMHSITLPPQSSVSSTSVSIGTNSRRSIPRQSSPIAHSPKSPMPMASYRSQQANNNYGQHMMNSNILPVTSSSSPSSTSPVIVSHSHSVNNLSASSNQSKALQLQHGHHQLHHSQQPQVSSISLKPSNISSSTTTTPTTPRANNGSSSHIHLWQFLKELLSQPAQYGSSIRWLDRSKGVFKIEDSVRVAKLWGSRKNRPAMNYDKLSRSIRQYYKKGIMKKTERSQRLVYQFCQLYSL